MNQRRTASVNPSRLLFISNFLPSPDGAGGTVYPHLLLNSLPAGKWKMDALILRATKANGWIVRHPSKSSYTNRIFFPWHLNFRNFSIGGKIGFHAATKPWDFITKWCRDNPHSPVVVNFTQSADWLRHVPADHQGPRIILTHEVIHQRTAAFEAAGQKPDFEPLSEEREIELCKRATHLAAIQADDARTFACMAPACTVCLLPPPFPTNPLPMEQRVPGRCIFVGGKSLTNQQAIKWFISECWPKVISAFPAAELHIFGSVANTLESPPDGVLLIGHVNHLASAYAEASVCLAPLLFGSGVKLKVLEAVAFGRPVVSTSIGLQGLKGWETEAVMLADDPVAFAHAVAHLLNNPDLVQSRIKNQLDLLKAAHAPDAVGRAFDHMLRPLRIKIGPN